MGRTLVPALLGACLAGRAATAGVDVDFGANVNVNDHTNLFFSISSRYYDRDRATVASFGARFGDPDDLSVALFISNSCGRSLDDIWVLRRQGLSWWDISVRYRVPADVWFVPVRRDPGPPYGKAYGHWKKRQRDPHAAFVLADPDIRNLVAVRMIRDYYGVPVETAMEWRASGRKVHTLMAEEYNRRHTKNTASSRSGSGGSAREHENAQGGKPGKGNGKNK
jgi:hypothetical protein